MKNENVIKMARLMVGCTDRTCEDCLSQSKKLFGDNKCALIEYAEVLDKAGYRKEKEVKAGYRKQSETVKEFAKKLKGKLTDPSGWVLYKCQDLCYDIDRIAAEYEVEVEK